MIRFPIPVDFGLPAMHRVHQHFDVPAAVDVTAAVNREWTRIEGGLTLPTGARIAVGVGSRGIADLAEVVAAVVAKLRSVGAQPFVIPAMGSHGGATAQGQLDLLAHLGITEERVGAPLKADMDVVALGTADGIPLYQARLAHEADGLVLVNRVKPHTDFSGPVESGLLKMLAVGLGQRQGADWYHRLAVRRGFYDLIVTAGRALLQQTRFLFGVAVVENQRHAVCDLRMALPGEVERTEIALLKKARTYVPQLPVDEIDLLIVDEMGKDISGAGLDPNVIGTSPCAWSDTPPTPVIGRIFVRSLTAATAGNASGIGVVDVATPRLVGQIDFQVTGINAITACCPEDCKTPMTLATEKQALAAALMALGPYRLPELRIVHIKNTLMLDHLFVSTGCLPKLRDQPGIRVEDAALTFVFDDQENFSYASGC